MVQAWRTVKASIINTNQSVVIIDIKVNLKIWSIFCWLWTVVFHVWQKNQGLPIQGWGCYLQCMWYVSLWEKVFSHQDQNKGTKIWSFWERINAMVEHSKSLGMCSSSPTIFHFHVQKPFDKPLMNARGAELKRWKRRWRARLPSNSKSSRSEHSSSMQQFQCTKCLNTCKTQ